MIPGRPRSIRQLAEYRHKHPEIPAWKPHCEFLDCFYESNDRAPMLSDQPLHNIGREDAYLAAVADYLSLIYEMAPPAWVEQPQYFLSEPWWPFGPANDAVKALYQRESPEPFRRRNIFTERHPLRRKLGPKPAGSID